MALRQFSAQIARLGAARAAASLPAMQRGFAAPSEETFTVEVGFCALAAAARGACVVQRTTQPCRD